MDNESLNLVKVMDIGKSGISHIDYQLADIPWDIRRFALGGQIFTGLVEPGYRR